MRPSSLCIVLSVMALSACSLDVVPVSRSRLISAWNAQKPIERGPDAPGAFRKTWKFSNAGGILLDPARIELQEDMARLKPLRPGIPKFGSLPSTIETATGRGFVVLDSFSEVVGPGHRGVLRYQLSSGDNAWYYHDGKKWVPAGRGSQYTNLASEVNAHVGTFHLDAGAGSLLVKAFLISPTGTEPVELKEIRATGIAPEDDSF